MSMCLLLMCRVVVDVVAFRVDIDVVEKTQRSCIAVSHCGGGGSFNILFSRTFHVVSCIKTRSLPASINNQRWRGEGRRAEL